MCMHVSRTEHSDLSKYFYSFHTPKFRSEVQHLTIFDNTMSASIFARLLM